MDEEIEVCEICGKGKEECECDEEEKEETM